MKLTKEEIKENLPEITLFILVSGMILELYIILLSIIINT